LDNKEMVLTMVAHAVVAVELSLLQEMQPIPLLPHLLSLVVAVDKVHKLDSPV
jgi:hypothetical protein